MMEEHLRQVSFNGIKAETSKCNIKGTETINVVFHLPEKRRILSTRDGFQEVQVVGENICPMELWDYAHKNGNVFRQKVLESLGETKRSCSLLFTGADPRQWALEVKHNELMVFLTVDFRTNAMRAGYDRPKGKRFRNQGTINIFLFTLNNLSDGAITRSIITATEAKCAALQDQSIKSSYNEKLTATGTGTDNIIIVPGIGEKIKLLRGHSPLSLAIGESVLSAMKAAIHGHFLS